MKQENWLKTILRFTKPCKGKEILAVFLEVISVLAGIIPYYGVFKIIVLFFNNEQTKEAILFWCAICLLGYVINLFFHAMSTVVAHISAYTILEGLRNELAEKLLKVPLGNVLNQTVGRLKSILIDRVENIELPLAHMIPEGFSSILLPLCIFVYLLTIDWRMAISALITIPLSAVVYQFVLKTYNQKYDSYMAANNHVNGVIVEYIEGIEVIKAFNQSTSSYKKFVNAVNMFKDYTLDWYRSTWKMMNLASAILPSSLLGTVPIGLLLYKSGSITPAEFVMCCILSLGIITPLTKFTVIVNDLKSVQYAVKDLNMILGMKELVEVEEDAVLHDFGVELKNVSFAYEDLGGEKGEQVLQGINLVIPQGSYTALVGPSGGGKSTVARLLARFWDADNGNILIGGKDIKDLPLIQLNDLVSFVTQDNFLFDASIKDNIRLGNPEATDDAVYAAAKAACCDEFIRQFEKGYDTTAGEAGARLSGGEKQRIAIARAILKNAPIVILDEATAFTDPENEDKIQNSLAALTKGKTRIVIAHRLSTIKNADQIVVIEKGKVIASGRHEELLEKCDLYHEMWEAHIGAKQWAANQEVSYVRLN
ncbi:ABC transporter ATP-binding protein [Flavonifractor sp. An306]|uniref:ABC transporter ATP-binding protein n=1 Tax=Flavonifractor sp. An306 TaxID=1965629 RepID=UPI0017493670|nr:ABC transporter ATP-binding protein [Flavonifractor sp. An306]HIZ55796.1 ABC transporter ATP-binding protein/permease [Bacillota bacterium]